MSRINWDVKPEGVRLWTGGKHVATLPKDQIAAFVVDAVSLLKPTVGDPDQQDLWPMQPQCNRLGHLWSDDGIGDTCNICGMTRVIYER